MYNKEAGVGCYVSLIVVIIIKKSALIIGSFE